jgi:hypothetical protein
MAGDIDYVRGWLEQVRDPRGVSGRLTKHVVRPRRNGDAVSPVQRPAGRALLDLLDRDRSRRAA